MCSCGWRSIPGVGEGFPFRAGGQVAAPDRNGSSRETATAVPIFSAEAPPANYVRFRISGEPVIAIGASIKSAGDQLQGCPMN